MHYKQQLMVLLAGKRVEVKWTGTAYKIISTSTSSQNVLITAVDSAIETNLKLTAANGGAENDYSFDLYDPTGNGLKREIFLKMLILNGTQVIKIYL